jgi:TonB family protein
MANRRRNTGLLTALIGLSLLLHVQGGVIGWTIAKMFPEPDTTSFPLELALVPEDEIVDAKKLEEKQEELKKEEEKEKEKEKDIKGQVVDLPPPLEEKRPDKSRFLSEYDTKVTKETKGPSVPFKPGRMVPNRPVARKQTTQPPSPQQRKQIERKVMKLAMRTQPELPRSELEKHEQGDEPAKVEKPEVQLPKGPKMPQSPKNASPKKRISLKDLKLSEKELAKALGSRVNDYLKNVAEGKQTLLNSKRWRFASFFNRVKRQVAQNWHPDVVYKRRDPKGNVYGFRDRLTVLRVKLSPAGKLKDIHLEKACGVGFLDDEAMSAFRAAEPFPNPPKGLVDKSTGMISFRFGFLFEISRRPNFKIFRFK